MERTHTAVHVPRSTAVGWGVFGVLLVAFALLRAVPAPAATNCTPGAWGTNRPDLASQVVVLVNEHRASIGRGPLSVSSTLEASSAWKSLHMAGNGYFAHDDPAPPVARSAYQRARDCDYAGGAWGENIAAGYGSAQAVMTGWLNSSGHKANIENASFTAIGVGVAHSAGGTFYWTQNFGLGPGAPPPAAPPPPAPPPPAEPPPPVTPSPPPPTETPPATASPATSKPLAPKPRTSRPPPAQPPAGGAPAVAAGLPIGAMGAKVGKPRAGTRLQARVAFVHLETKRRVETGSVRCRALLGTTRLRVVTNAFSNGYATCAWRVPAGAKGRMLTGIVAVQIGQKAARRVFVRWVT